MNTIPENRFVVNKKSEKFQLFYENKLVAESYFSIENPDNLYDEKYIGIFKVKTIEKYRGRGFMRTLLTNIFEYTKNNLNIQVILLNVYLKNAVALNLYLSLGFEIFKEDEDDYPYYTLIKHL